MKSLISFNAEFYEKSKFEQEQEDSFTQSFAKVVLVFLVLFLVWNGYCHYDEVNLLKNGTAVPATVSVSGKDTYVSFTAKDGNEYEERLSGMFLNVSDGSGISRIRNVIGLVSVKPGDTITVYYLDDPSDAMPLSEPYFYYGMYAISIVGIALMIWWIKR